MSTDDERDPLVCRFMRRFITEQRKQEKRIRNSYRKKEQYTGTRKGFKRMKKARGQKTGSSSENPNS